jgi:hypothetical protein
VNPSPPPRDRSQDPRDRITPDAFSVDPDLLGIPLAGHRRRVLAMLVDLGLIALLRGAGGMVLGILAALFFIRVALGRKKGQPASVAGTALRGTAGCLGGFILFITVVSTWGVFQGLLRPSPPDVRSVADGAVVWTPGVRDLVGGFQEVQSLRRAEGSEEARRAASLLAERLRQLELEDEDIAEFLREMAPGQAAWRDSLQAWAGAPVPAPGEAPGEAIRPRPADPAVDPGQDTVPAADALPPPSAAVDTLPLPEVLERYAALLDELGEAVEESETARLLRQRIAEELAGDTIAALESQLSRETRDRLRAERAVVAREQQDPGIRSWLRALAADFGLGVGWAALYFTVFLSWWNGFTPGKRLLGLRVVRLDGSPITWWTALERYGGYAAGFATGLLGFIQVYWDPNRQATHDKLAGTVVIRHGVPPLSVYAPPDRPQEEA